MSLLAIKLIVTPLVVLAATLAARRTVRSPASVAQAAFCFGYAALARRGVAAALVSGTLAYGAFAAVLLDAGLSTFALFLATVVALTILLWLMPRLRPSRETPSGGARLSFAWRRPRRWSSD